MSARRWPRTLWLGLGVLAWTLVAVPLGPGWLGWWFSSVALVGFGLGLGPR